MTVRPYDRRVNATRQLLDDGAKHMNNRGERVQHPTTSFVFQMPDDKFFRCQLEMLTADEGRWLLTDGAGIIHVGPDAIAGESQEDIERRLLAWWQRRFEAGHWSRGKGR